MPSRLTLLEVSQIYKPVTLSHPLAEQSFMREYVDFDGLPAIQSSSSPKWAA